MDSSYKNMRSLLKPVPSFKTSNEVWMLIVFLNLLLIVFPIVRYFDDENFAENLRYGHSGLASLTMAMYP